MQSLITALWPWRSTPRRTLVIVTEADGLKEQYRDIGRVVHTYSGALVIFSAKGNQVYAYAQGAWRKCEERTTT